MGMLERLIRGEGPVERNGTVATVADVAPVAVAKALCPLAIPDGLLGCPVGVAWTVDPTRRVSQPLTDARVDALSAAWRARYPGR